MFEIMKKIEEETKNLRKLIEEADEIGLKPANPLSVYKQNHE